MIRKKFALLALGFASVLSAHAQLGLYGAVTVDNLATAPFSTYDINGPVVKSGVNPVGGTFGAYYDLRSFGPVRLGVDARFVALTTKEEGIAYAQGGGTRIYSGLGGIRAAFHTPIDILQPYLQGSIGYGRVNNGEATPLTQGIEYHGFAGLDVKLLPQLSLRAIELGYGGIDPSGTTGQRTLKSASVGVVFHLR